MHEQAVYDRNASAKFCVLCLISAFEIFVFTFFFALYDYTCHKDIALGQIK